MPQRTALLSRSQTFPNFDVFSDFSCIILKIDCLAFGIHPGRQKTNWYSVCSWKVSWNGMILIKKLIFFKRPCVLLVQCYSWASKISNHKITDKTVWTEYILLVSGCLVKKALIEPRSPIFCFWTTFLAITNQSLIKNGLLQRCLRSDKSVSLLSESGFFADQCSKIPAE